MRYSIRTLLGIVAVAAAVFAVLLTSIHVMASCVVIACLSVLLGSTLGITYTREKRRAFWIGFAVFGWGYILAKSSFHQTLATSIALDYLSRVGPVAVRIGGFNPARQAVIEAGHCLWSLLFAALGGMFNRYLWSLHEQAAPPAVSLEHPTSN